MIIFILIWGFFGVTFHMIVQMQMKNMLTPDIAGDQKSCTPVVLSPPIKTRTLDFDIS